MAAPCLRTVGSLATKCGHCCKNINRISCHFSAQMVRRPLSVSASLLKKNQAASGPEKYTPEFIQKQVEEYNIGKRHLANMMGEDPDTFTQEDVDRSIAYLFPSGLFEKKARPLMKHPDEIFPKQRAIQWDTDGRPFHFLFYTGKQSYYSLMHELYGKVLGVERYQDRMRAKGLFSKDDRKIVLGTSRWLSKEELEAQLVETISSQDYTRLIQLMERLVAMPYGAIEQEFVMSFRQQLDSLAKSQVIQPLQRDEQGVAFSTAEGRRKSSTCSVLLRDCGSGQISINGLSYILYFPVLQDREQLMFPFQFTNTLGRFDLQCTVEGGGRSGQVGALRLAISRALLSFLPEEDMENLRQAGLLTPDPRVRERKKPGQEGARRKFTWKKR
ncbi:28S ribosomal protein S9, mitochondrial [Boleophthalmus pectinirostris]|uniref:28S ribosomal protein S9, mitochondrial n=1 Tax=Boleophthalmus pectinirostris TaxID=150288 RepID=UPI00242B77A6|nr:28S ribosomal protein S9, mitochondrial [Boleophthalmus pectinirostris]